MNGVQVLRALKSVSEKKLLLIDLMNEVTNERGEVDYELLSERQPEVNLARAEAQAYINEVQRTTTKLRNAF